MEAPLPAINLHSSRTLSRAAALSFALVFLQPVTAAGKDFSKGSGTTKAAAGWVAPVDEDQLTDFVAAAYDQHGRAEFSTSVTLRAKIVSSLLPVADHHHRLTERMGPGFEGFFLALRNPHPRLEFVEVP